MRAAAACRGRGRAVGQHRGWGSAGRGGAGDWAGPRAVSGLARWRREQACHDPGRVLLHLATSIATGGDCLADIGVLRAQPDLFGVVASDPTVSRLVDTLAGDVDDALAAVRGARATARAAVWAHRRPVGPGPVVIDIDGSLVVALSEKQSASPTFKQTFGFHPVRREAL